jgi:uncharacterized protein
MIFVDTWAWIALANRRDAYHGIALPVYDEMLARGEVLVTSDSILSEAISRLYPYVGHEQASHFINSLLLSQQEGVVRVEHVSEDRFLRSWTMRQRYADKPHISFLDFTSMVIMQDLRITGIFTGDRHFEQVGLGFRLHPQNA